MTAAVRPIAAPGIPLPVRRRDWPCSMQIPPRRISFMTHSLSDPETWLESHGDSLYRYALARLGNAAEAEDLVQDTLIAAIESRDRFAGNSQERTWLTGIMKHKVIDRLRVRHREAPAEFDLDGQQPEVGSHFDSRGNWLNHVQPWVDPDDALQQDEFFVTLEKCIDALPDRSAEAFRLKELHGMDTAAIREALDIGTDNNLWVILSRARMQLRDCLSENWFASDKAEPC